MNPAAEAIARAAYEVIEEGMFLFIERGGAEACSDPICYTMAIEGAHRAAVGIRLCRPVARSLAANILGVDEDSVTDEDCEAAAAEALNVVAGRMLAHLVGTEVELELCPPEPGGQPRGTVVPFRAEGGALRLWHDPCPA